MIYMAKRPAFIAALVLLWLLSACTLQVPVVVVTATPEGTPTPLIATATTESTAIATHPLATHTPIPTATIESTPSPEVLRRWRIGYNANGLEIPDKAYLLAHIRDACTQTQLVMDNLPLADEIYRILKACLPAGLEPIVIVRDYSPQEGGECTQTTASQMVNRWIAQGYKHLIRYSVNEPVYNEQTWMNCLRREIQLMQLARMHGFTVAMTNFAVGSIQPQWIEAGIFDDYLRALNQYGHYLAVHEYTSAVLAFGVGLMPRECLLDPACVQPQHWATPDDVPIQRWGIQAQVVDSFGFEMLNKAYGRAGYTTQAVNGFLPPYWHILRFTWFWIRQDELGIPRTPVLITEGPWDHMNDIENVLTPLEDRWSLSRYLWDLRGINTYYDSTPQVDSLWEFYFPQWTHEEAALCQLIWLNNIYPDGVAGVTMFTWSSNAMWSGFDFSGRQNVSLVRLHRLIEAQARGHDQWQSVCLRAA